MTRRLDPLDRVRELGDASVPFRFDDSMSTPSSSPRTLSAIEAKMHTCLTDRRVNRVNQRREFFYATPHEVKEHLLALTGDLLQYDEAGSTRIPSKPGTEPNRKGGPLTR